jgi:hypothetical protein
VYPISGLFEQSGATRLTTPVACAAEGYRQRAHNFALDVLARAIKDGYVRPLASAPVPADASKGERPPWLEPYGGDPTWHQQMWGAIVAPRGRYPHQLETLKDKWWTDDSTTETLAALTTWRAELDETRQDPRDELAFQTQLNDYAQHLQQQPGGVTKTWKPSPPPPEWARP